MAESTSGLLRTHPLEAWAEAFARLPESIAVTALPFVAMVDVRLAAPSERLEDRPADRSQHLGAHRRTGASSGSGPTSGC